MPKAMKAGARLGTRLTTPSFRLLSTITRMPDMSSSAPKDAQSMLFIFLSER